MSRIEKLLAFLETSPTDSFLQHALALEYIKAHASLLNLDEEIFDNWNIHVHVPEGAIPKDGPSAGVALFTALCSLVENRPVDSKIAMTGEITLSGNILPVGGIKEKVLAAHRAQIKRVVLPERNAGDLKEVGPEITKELEFFFVKDIAEVLKITGIISDTATLAPIPTPSAIQLQLPVN